MPAPILAATVGLACAVLILLATILLMRARGDRRRRREDRARTRMEALIADSLAGEREAARPDDPLERRMLLLIGLEALIELRGVERDQVTEILRRTGLIADLASELGSRSTRTRRLAAQGLGLIRARDPLVALVDCLDDPDAGVRLAAAAALAELGDDYLAEAAIVAADEVAHDRSGEVVPVILTIGRTAPSALARAMRAGTSAELRQITAAVIGELRLAMHAPLMRAALDDDEDELVSRAARGLGEIGDADAVPALIDLLGSDRSWFVKLSATTALGKIGDPQAVAPLEKHLGADEWQIREATAGSLAALGSPGRDVLERAGAEGDSETAVRARVALAS